jgi:cyanophycinase
MPPGPLFLLGGSDGDVCNRIADDFVEAAGGEAAVIALLLIGGEGWEAHAGRYRALWDARGVRRAEVLVPDGGGRLDLLSAEQRLRAATGIFIGGGRTATYHQLYASEPLRSVIRQRHRSGAPVVGLSAGAMLVPELCMLRPTPRDPDQTFMIVEGLGLIRDLIVEVHFAETPGALPSLLEGMARTRTARGLGLGSTACARLANGQLVGGFGPGVYEVTMADFETRRHVVVERVDLT